MTQVRAGFVGCGAHTTRNLYPVLSDAGIDLAAACDLDKRKAQRVCRQFGAHRCYQDLGAMIDEMDLDAVLVSGPPELHAETALQCLAAGRHVWMESPPAPSLAEAERIAQTAREKKLIVQVGFMMRFAPAYARLKAAIDDEAFGEPVAVQAQYCTGRASSHRQHLLLDGLHILDLVRHLMGQPSALSAVKCERGGQITSQVALRFGSGAIGTVHLSSLQPRALERVQVSGDGVWASVEGRVRLRCHLTGQSEPAQNVLWEPDLSMQDLENSTGYLQGYLPGLAHFAASVRGEAEPAATIDDAVAAMKIAEAIEANEGEMIEVG